jgi:hypothetical protein
MRIQLITMTRPQGMDEWYWGKDHEDVNKWVEHLNMAVEVQDFNDDKLFKIAKLNLHDRKKEYVATPFLEKCEDDTHTPEMRTWESFRTFKTSEFNCRSQNTLP